MGAPDENLVLVPVFFMGGNSVGTFQLPFEESVKVLKQKIAAAGGPATSEQTVIGAHRVLNDSEIIGKALAEAGGQLMLVVMQSCPSCKGACSCTLCGCAPQYGLIDYYGFCKACGQCGGHASRCQFCIQAFPSMCALDTHVRFGHPREYAAGEWHTARMDEHLQKQAAGHAPLAGTPAEGTFLEACRGGLGPVAWIDEPF